MRWTRTVAYSDLIKTPIPQANVADERFTLIPENFRHARNFLRLNGVRIDGMLADLGVSSTTRRGRARILHPLRRAFGHANEPTRRAVCC